MRFLRPTLALLASLAFAPAALAQYSQQQKLTATDGHSFDQFGISVAISGDTLLSGAYQDDSSAGADTGSAYVFHANGASWTRQAKLVASDAHLDDEFGSAVALWGDTAVVGARFVDTNGTNSGAAYVFTRSAGVWSQQQKLLAFDGAPFDGFGASVAIRGDTLVVGAPTGSSPMFESGSAYVFTRSGTTWTLQQKLVAADAAQSDGFGVAVALEEDLLLVGTPGKDLPALDAGAAYVFARNGSIWTQVQRLTAPDFATNDFFGISVALSGGTAAIGSSRDDDAGTDSGSVYVFTGAGSSWSLQQKLTASTGAPGDWFGKVTAIAGDRLLVGAPIAVVGPVRRGTAYVFERRDGHWSEAQQLNSTDPLFDGGEFGSAVALSGERLAIGDRQDEPHGQQSGAAFVFTAGEPGIAACFGVGCPCGNDDPGAGCANANGAGARLGGSGTCSVTSDDLLLQATQLPANRIALFTVGASSGSLPFGHGLQCTAGPLFLYQAQLQSSGPAGVATLDHPAANSAGFIHAGDTRCFQVLYGDGALAQCGAARNWTNLYSVAFAP
jgi:hypothetical protein